MKTYLGAGINIFITIVLLTFLLLSAGLAIWVIIYEKSFESILAFLLFMYCFVGIIIVLYKFRYELLSWGTFSKNGVIVHTLFEKTTLPYSSLTSCGIAFYRHAYMNRSDSSLGSNVFYIYLCKDVFPKQYKRNINLWRSSKNNLKVGYSPKLYIYLQSVLPKKLAASLAADYLCFGDHLCAGKQ